MIQEHQIRVRVYQGGDKQGVIALWNEVFPDPAPRNDPGDSIAHKLAVNDDLFLVAEENHSIVGTVMGGYDGHRGWVYSLAVNSSARRRGIGTALMEHLEAALARCGCPKINLQVLADNTDVVAFYEDLGYQVEQRVSMGKVL